MRFDVGGVNYLKTKFSAIDGFTTVSFKEDDSDFEIRANQQGIWFQGTMKVRVGTPVGLQDLAKLVSLAWAEHMKLKPRLAMGFNNKEH